MAQLVCMLRDYIVFFTNNPLITLQKKVFAKKDVKWNYLKNLQLIYIFGEFYIITFDI